jgi:hypothetical protein
MKYATSIKLGGELVAAIDSDYGDYKRLQLLCPNCKEPVFLQSLSKRVLGEREVSVCPHFKHFSVPDASLAVQCEQRVSVITEDDIRKAKAIARGQRLKKLQLAFWSLFIKGSKTSGHCLNCANQMQKEIDRFLKPDRAIFIKNQNFTSDYGVQDFYKDYIHGQDLNSFLNRTDEVRTKLLGNIDLYFLNPHADSWQRHKDVFSRHANISTQSKILEEIVSFLCTKSSKNLLLNCVAFGIIAVATERNQGIFEWFRSALITEKMTLWEVGLSAFCMELIKIDWLKALSHVEDLNINSSDVTYSDDFKVFPYNETDEWYCHDWIGEESITSDWGDLKKCLSHASDAINRNIHNPWEDDVWAEVLLEEEGQENDYVKEKTSKYKVAYHSKLNKIKYGCLSNGYYVTETFSIIHGSLYDDFMKQNKLN